MSELIPNGNTPEKIKNSEFLNYCKEGWHNLKNRIAEKRATLKYTIKSLNVLKRDVTAGKQQACANSSDETKDSSRHNSNESVETQKKNVREKLLEIVSRDRKASDVCKDDGGSVSLGMLQWHGSKAIKVLEKAKSVDSVKFESIMTDPIFKDLNKAGKSSWNDTQANQYKKLMDDPRFHKPLNDFALETVDGYIKEVKSWGVSNSQAILARGRLCNYGSGFAKKLCTELKNEGGNINDYNKVIDKYESTPQGKKHQKFSEPKKYYGGKNLRQVIGEYKS